MKKPWAKHVYVCAKGTPASTSTLLTAHISRMRVIYTERYCRLQNPNIKPNGYILEIHQQRRAGGRWRGFRGLIYCRMIGGGLEPRPPKWCYQLNLTAELGSIIAGNPLQSRLSPLTTKEQSVSAENECYYLCCTQGLTRVCCCAGRSTVEQLLWVFGRDDVRVFLE